MTCSLFRRRIFWSSRHTELSLSSCLGKLSGTVCKPCLIAFLELSSCFCMDDLRPHLSLRAPHRCTKRSQPVSHVLNNCCHSRVLPRRVVVPTVSFSASLLQGHGLLAGAACLESLPTLVLLQLPVLLERGLVVLLCRSRHQPAPPLHAELSHLSQG